MAVLVFMASMFSVTVRILRCSVLISQCSKSVLVPFSDASIMSLVNEWKA